MVGNDCGGQGKDDLRRECGGHSKDDLHTGQDLGSSGVMTDLLDEFLEAEELLWQHGPDTDTAGCQQDHGMCYNTIRNSRALFYIHGYFANFESRKCCLNLAAGQSRLNGLRVVSTSMTREGLEEGAMRKQHAAIVPVDILSRKEFQVFKKCTLLTNFAVLAVPTPSQDSSPLTPDLGRSNHKYRPNSRISALSFADSLSWGSDPDDVDLSIIPSEMLCDLVGQLFGLSGEKTKQYQRVVFESYGRRSDAKILAEEMANQLALLENNKHPYYSQTSFLTRQGYEAWQQVERKHILNLINKFWQIALPPVKNVQSEHHHHHDDYHFLLLRLLRYEKGQRSDTGTSNLTPVTPLLSCASSRLLKEFALRYRVGELFCKVVYLEYLAENFENEVCHIHHTVLVMSTILDLFPSNRAKAIIVQSEYNQLDSIIEVILGQCRNSLTRIKRLFQNRQSPAEGVGLLIDLLSTTLTLKSYLHGCPETAVDSLLYQYIQVNFEMAYERHKIIGVTDLGLDPLTPLLTPKLLNRLMTKVRDEVHDYQAKYQAVFERYFDISRVAAQSFYSYLMEDTQLLCHQKSPKRNASELDLTMLSLMFRLNQLDMDWAIYIPSTYQTWRESFLDEMCHWFAVLHRHCQRLVLQTLALEKFKVLKFEETTAPVRGGNSGRASSTLSSVSLTPSAHSAFSAVKHHQKPLSAIPSFRKSSNPAADKEVLGLEELEESFRGKLSMSVNLPLVLDEKSSNGHRSSYRSRSDTKSESDIMKATTERSERSQHKDIHDKFTVVNPNHDVAMEMETCVDDVVAVVPVSRHLPETSDVNVPRTAHASLSLASHEAAAAAAAVGNVDDVDEIRPNSTTAICDHLNSDALSQDSETSSDTCFDDQQPYPPITMDTASLGWQSASWQSASCEFTANNFDICDVKQPVTSEPGAAVNNPSVKSELHAGIATVRPDNSQQVKESLREAVPVNDPMECSTPFVGNSGEQRPRPVTKTMPTGRDFLLSVSILEVIALLQRVLHVVEMIHTTLLPKLSSEVGGSDSERPGRMDCTDVGRTLGNMAHDHLMKIVGEVIALYADNLLSMDLCGVTEFTANRLITKQLVSHLHDRKSHDLIWGCRHMINNQRDCYFYVKRNVQYLSDKYEPITQEMCTRINHVTELKVLTKLFFVKVGKLVTHFQAFGTTTVPEPQTAPCERHLLDIQQAMIQVLSFRIHCFFREAFSLLLALSLPGISITGRLQPLTEFLNRHLAALQHWLYPASYVTVVTALWDMMVKSIEKEVINLRELENGIRSQAENMLKAISVFIRCVSLHGNGISINELTSKMDCCTFWLQLYMEPTVRLISAYHLLHNQGGSQASSTQPLLLSSEQQERMKKQLHAVCKVFCGRDLVDWIRDNLVDTQIEGSQDLSPPADNDREAHCLLVAQKLLDSGIILGVDPSAISSESSYVGTTSFPDIICYSTPSLAMRDSASRLGADFKTWSQSLETAGDFLGSDQADEGLTRTDVSDSMGTERGGDSQRGGPMFFVNSETDNPDRDSRLHQDSVFLSSTPSHGTPTSDVSKFHNTTTNFYRVANMSLEDFEVSTPASSKQASTVGLSSLVSGEDENAEKVHFFKQKQVTAELVVGVIAGRKKHDALASHFLRDLPLSVVQKYPWLMVYKQPLLPCLRF